MRACVQRVSQASVSVGLQIVGRIDHGLVVLLGIGQGDVASDAILLATKIVKLRIFDDADGKLNRSLVDVQGSVLVISQFTLLGNCWSGRRPSFVSAAAPEVAESLYQTFVASVKQLGIPAATGVFRANMKLALVNDGPVTLLLDSRKTF